MFRRRVLFGTGAALIAVFLLLAGPALAGDRYHAPSQPTVRHTPAAAPVPVARPTWQATAVSVVLTPPAAPPANPGLTVRLRGPNGEVRRFPVEGGYSAIQFARPVVLRAGQSITIRWVAAR